MDNRVFEGHEAQKNDAGVVFALTRVPASSIQKAVRSASTVSTFYFTAILISFIHHK